MRSRSTPDDADQGGMVERDPYEAALVLNLSRAFPERTAIIEAHAGVECRWEVIEARVVCTAHDVIVLPAYDDLDPEVAAGKTERIELGQVEMARILRRFP